MNRIVFIILIIASGLRAQEYMYFLSEPADFETLSGMPLTVKYGQVDAVKIVYDIRDEQIYYINAQYFRYHHEFCRNFLEYEVSVVEFNRLNYSDLPYRKYLLANINHFRSLDAWVLEISPVDRMTETMIRELYSAVESSSFFGDSLKLLINSAHLSGIIPTLDSCITTLHPSDLYYSSDYQSLSNQSASGILRINSDVSRAGPRDILVLDHTPDYLPMVSGIILTEFQTPLSHMTLLGRNRKIPVCVVKNAPGNSFLRDMEGEQVRLTVQQDTFFIVPVSHLDDAPEHRNIQLNKDLSVRELINIDQINRRSSDFVGNKAANLGELYKLSRKGGFRIPESAFAIPFWFYEQHMIRSGADILIAELLNTAKEEPDRDSLMIFLSRIREVIISCPPDPALIEAIDSRVRELGPYRRMRFRSSTNAEDAEGFSGAGLYSSKTGIVGDSLKPVGEAVCKVWASLWSYEAFAERSYFGIDHEQVAMGILVHRSFPDEEVNGVAITKNIYRENGYGFVVNAQRGDISVVDPDPGITCDQLICYPNQINYLFRSNKVIDVITFGNMNHGQLVMTDDEIIYLANQLERIKRSFHQRAPGNPDYPSFGMDIEFKLDGPDRALYIKQARYYND